MKKTVRQNYIDDDIIIYNERGQLIDTKKMERPEQNIARKFIQPDDVVLELGARYGSVSVVINSILKNKKNQVSVEPDERVWDALEYNKKVNRCNFNIVKGFLSNKKLGLTNLNSHYGGYGATAIEDKSSKIKSYTLDQIKKKYGIAQFNVLVADCEGFLEQFFDENPELYDELDLVIFESDYKEKCDYDKIKYNLFRNGFKNVREGHQNIWSR